MRDYIEVRLFVLVFAVAICLALAPRAMTDIEVEQRLSALTVEDWQR